MDEDDEEKTKSLMEVDQEMDAWTIIMKAERCGSMGTISREKLTIKRALFLVVRLSGARTS